MLVVGDALDAVYLGSFLFGLLFSALSLLLGVGHGGHGHVQPGGGAHHGGHHPPGHAGHDPGSDRTGTRVGSSLLSVGAALACLTWFGGVGYLARHALGAMTAVSLGLGVVAGLAAGLVVARFLGLLVREDARVLNVEDYRLPGTIARVTSSIRAGGTGEIVYEQAGVRQVSAARVKDGTSVARGAEVVVLACAHGVALVEPAAAFFGERHADVGTGFEAGADPTHPPPDGRPRVANRS